MSKVDGWHELLYDLMKNWSILILPFVMELSFLGLYHLIHLKNISLDMNLLIAAVVPSRPIIVES